MAKSIYAVDFSEMECYPIRQLNVYRNGVKNRRVQYDDHASLGRSVTTSALYGNLFSDNS